jgi:hypothetical protein
MGIFRFYPWFKRTFPQNITPMKAKDTVSDFNVTIDTLMIDLNGLFHNSAQIVYQYGNFAPRERLGRRKPRRRQMTLRKQIECFEHVCKTIEELITTSRPQKRLVLCIDGPAPLSKQNQQRQRRFKSAMEAEEKEMAVRDDASRDVIDEDANFDSNCITPGTKFMDFMSKYIDRYIRAKITTSAQWQALDVVFSNEKVPGEGEHKCQKKGTKILLWNGSIKNVEDIAVKDVVIGDDGTPRTVTSLVSGRDEMYEIVQNNAENYTVNKNHILSLQIADYKQNYWSEKEGAWIFSWYNRETNRFQRKQFAGLRDGETPFINKTYTTRENYGKHKLKTGGRTTAKTKEEAYNDLEAFAATIDDDNTLDISVTDYMFLPNNTKRKLYGFRCTGVQWPKKATKIDPYLLGLWLGDGVSTQPVICTIDDEVVQFLIEYCDAHNFVLNSKYITYHIAGSRIVTALKKYNLLGNKHIPREYLINDRETRLNVLAGIIDSDGNVTKNGRLVRISQCLEHKQLVDDIVYLSRSLGFCVNVRTANTTWVYNGEKKQGECYQITISGDLHTIPMIIPRKQCSPPPIPGKNGRSIVVDKLRTSITVEPAGVNEYYGFNTDGNHRYLLGDFTVTHNCVNFIRAYGEEDESFCIHGLDADLIMLSLGTHKKNFYILRDDVYGFDKYFLLNIGNTRQDLVQILQWDGKDTGHKFDPVRAVNDFIFMCFMCGNDFLKHTPSIEIMENGIDVMFDVYKNVCESFGHLTEIRRGGSVYFLKTPFTTFLGTLAGHEKSLLENKLQRKDIYFPDEMMEQHASLQPSKMEDGGSVWELDFDDYKNEYNDTHFNGAEGERQASYQFLEGLQWVLSYYTRGVPNWNWCYPYNYTPFASTVIKHIDEWQFPNYGRSGSISPFQQLLCVLPRRSADLLPEPFCSFLKDETTEFAQFCPDKEDIVVDISGKKNEYEGVVILPKVDISVMRKHYFQLVEQVDKRDAGRNRFGKSFVYTHSPDSTYGFKSFYGDVQNCSARLQEILI